MSKSTQALQTALRELHQERTRLVRSLTKKGELAVGSVSVVRRKCGKPGCHCAEDVGHPQTLFLFKGEAGRRRCKLVRRADETRLLAASRRYREFREGLRQLRAINRREEQILMALMEARALSYE
jgi:hypothetical protein